jgi:hypothetical protein
MNGKHLWARLLYTAAAVGGGIIGGALADYARHFIWPVAVAETAANSQIISANEFRLLDEAGKVRARLFLFQEPSWPEESKLAKLALYDWHGDEQVSLTSGDQRVDIDKKGGQLALFSSDGAVLLRAHLKGGGLLMGRTGPGRLSGDQPMWDSPEVDLGTGEVITSLFLGRWPPGRGKQHNLNAFVPVALRY